MGVFAHLPRGDDCSTRQPSSSRIERPWGKVWTVMERDVVAEQESATASIAVEPNVASPRCPTLAQRVFPRCCDRPLFRTRPHWRDRKPIVTGVIVPLPPSIPDCPHSRVALRISVRGIDPGVPLPRSKPGSQSLGLKTGAIRSRVKWFSVLTTQGSPIRANELTRIASQWTMPNGRPVQASADSSQFMS